LSTAPRPRPTRELLALAGPAIASYLLNNFYRINDQFWIQGLGGDAQAAVGAAMYVVILNFAVIFLAVGGSLSLVARAKGARRPEEGDSLTRHALLLATGIGIAMAAVGAPMAESIVAPLGLADGPAEQAVSYLRMLYLVSIPLALAPTLDHLFLARGNSLIPMFLQILAIALNYTLNPILIYGSEAGIDAPGAEFAAGIARTLGIPAMGIAGAALATGIARTMTGVLGLLLLFLAYGVHPVGSGRPRASRLLAIARIGAPVAGSIAVYAAVYVAMIAFVLSELDPAVTAGLGIGFQVFEGVAFPCFLGVATATASLVGRSLGARDEAGALETVRAARRVGNVLGVLATIAFLVGARPVAERFSLDPRVQEETVRYVVVLAFSQLFVAVETINEKVLLGAGRTRPILWISTLGNVVRIPLAWLLAIRWGAGALGVWWAINLTTYAKAWLFRREVQKGEWLHHGLEAVPPAVPAGAPASHRIEDEV
jgi:MATE family multidrug resistance protein